MAQTSAITYTASDENFPNPERGLYHYTELRSPNTGLTVDELRQFREQESITLIYRIFYLEEFRSQPISEEYLATMRQDFATMREAGVKCVLRFAYTDSFVNGFDNPPYNDAPPLDLLLQHVDQLAPIIRSNVDVVAVMQAGFIGTWGEWYYTDHYTTSGNLEQPNETDWANRRSLIDKLLQVLPPSRMVQVRYPVAKFNITGSEEPLAAEDAYQNTPRARIAHHNDCFVSSPTDVGTYKNLEPEKAFLEQDSRYLAIGGETCALSSPTSDCPNAEAELARFHWSYLNVDYNTDVLDAWETQGCWESIVQQLGYRFRLTEATLQNQASPGGAFSLTLSLVNDGYASPYNSRQVNVILRNTDNGEIFVHRTDEDPRRWLPGDPITIEVEAGVPASLANGNYEVLLHLADPEPTVADRAEYAIRLANEAVWEAETGYNSLQHTLTVTAGASGSPYQGDQYFLPLTEQLIDGPTRIRVDGQATDWNNVRPAATAGSSSALRVFNRTDSLYFLVEGERQPTGYRLFLDTDNQPATGYQNANWPTSGLDYLVEDGQLKAYAGDGATDQWTVVATATVAATGTILEIGVASSSLGALPRFFRLGCVSNDQAIPAGTQSLPTVSWLPEGLGSPIAVKATPTGGQAIVYWGKILSGEERELVLERSRDAGVSYEEVTTLDTSAIAYTDRNLTPSTELRYRLYTRSAARFSDYSNVFSITLPEEASAPPPPITLGGGLDDWNGIAPLATTLSSSLRAMRVFNDRQNLYFSIEGDSSSRGRLFIDVDDDPATGYAADDWSASGADILVENNIVYHYTDDLANPWEAVGTAATESSEMSMEGALPLASLPPGTSRQIRLAWSSGPQGTESTLLPTSGQAWPTYRLALLSAVPDDFRATLSAREPTSRVLLGWADVDDEQGYRLERSEGDSTHFEQITELAANTDQFLDTDLAGGTTFYYRIRSFNAAGESEYSPIVSATTEGGAVTGLADESAEGPRLQVYPNPAYDQATVTLRLSSPQTVTLTVYNVWGAAQEIITQGTYASGTHFFTLSNIVKGSPNQVLFIRLEGREGTALTSLSSVRLLTY